jgi:rod shape-determining protein MreB
LAHVRFWAIGTAQISADSREAVMSVKGRDLVHGIPREIEISQSDIAGPLNDLTNQIVEAVTTEYSCRACAPETGGD